MLIQDIIPPPKKIKAIIKKENPKLISFILILVLVAQTISGLLFLPKAKKAQAVGETWYNSSWTHRKQITIDHTKVADVATPSTTYANFPVLVSLDSLSNINVNGTDIRFTSSDGVTELPREIESYSSGSLKAWVKTTLTKDSSDSTDDIIYMYYGNSSATEPAADSTYGSQNVWKTDGVDTSEMMVQHMKDTTASTITDSTSNANNGTKKASNEPLEADSQIAKGQTFDGTDDYVNAGNGTSLDTGTGDFTIESWINTSANLTDSLGDIVSKFDQTNKKGFNFGFLKQSSFGSQSNYGNLFFGIDNNKPDNIWVEKATLGAGIEIISTAVYNGKLYGGDDKNGKLYEWNGVDAWVEKAPKLSTTTIINSLAVFNGKLYGGTSPNGKLYEWNGVDAWVEKASQLSLEIRIRSLAVFNGKLYGGTYPNGKLYEWNGVDAWVEKAPLLNDETYTMSLAVYNGKLYGGMAPNGKLYEWNGINAWVEKAPKLGTETWMRSLAVYNGKLYSGTAENGKLYEWNGVNAWIEKASELGAEYYIQALGVYNGKLYAGTYPNGKLLEWNGVNAWIEKAPKLGSETYTQTLTVFNGKLYAGTYPNGKLLEWKTGVSTSYDYELSSGLHHLVAAKDNTALKLYIDGVLVATSYTFTPSDYDLTNANNLLIGFGQQDYFNGSLDEVRIYSRALTAQEITTQYNNQNSPSTFAVSIADIISPSSFTLSSPADNSSTSSTQPTLSWNASTDSESGLAKYQLYIDNALNTDNISSSATSTILTSSPSCGPHTWYIKALDNAGNSTDSDTFTFYYMVNCGSPGGSGLPPVIFSPTPQPLPEVAPGGAIPLPSPTPSLEPTLTPSPVPNPQSLLSSGDLARASNDYKVYRIQDNQKQWIKSVLEFISSGYDWNKVIVVNSSVLAAYSDAASTIFSSYFFSRNLKLGNKGSDVKELQKLLNSKGFPVSLTGPGSPGKETDIFGSLTQRSLIKFQEAHAAEILAPFGLKKGTGFFGNGTRGFMNGR